MSSILFSKYLGEKFLAYGIEVCFVFLKNLPDCFQSGCTIYFTLLPTMCGNSGCSTSVPTFGGVSFLSFGYSGGFSVAFRCSWNLYFPDDWWCQALVHIGRTHYILLWSFCLSAKPFFIAFWLLLSCKFWIFWIDVLFRYMYYKYFSPSIVYLFIFLIVFLKNKYF